MTILTLPKPVIFGESAINQNGLELTSATTGVFTPVDYTSTEWFAEQKATTEYAKGMEVQNTVNGQLAMPIPQYENTTKSILDATYKVMIQRSSPSLPHITDAEYNINAYVHDTVTGIIYRAKEITTADLTDTDAWENTGLNIADFLIAHKNADNITSGTLDDARLSENVTLQGNTFNVANGLVQLDGAGNLPSTIITSDSRPSTTVVALLGNDTGTVVDARSVCIMRDGVIKTAGTGTDYSAAGGDSNNIYKPTNVAIDSDNPPTSKFVLVVSGHDASWGLTEDGDAYSWGSGVNGALGHGNTLDQAFAKRIAYFYDAGIKITKIISAKNHITTGVAENAVMFISDANNGRKLYFCGSNEQGVGGDGTQVDKFIPTQVGTLTDVVNVVISNSRLGTALIETNDGVDKKLWVTGLDIFDLAEVGNTSSKTTPTELTAYRNNFISYDISYGIQSTLSRFYAAIVKANGDVCFIGNNSFGQLGFGNTTTLTVWTQNTFVSNVKKVITGSGYWGVTVLIFNDDTINTAGHNEHGCQGQGNTTTQTSFVSPVTANADTGFQGKVDKVVINTYLNIVPSVSLTSIIILDTDGMLYGAGYGLDGQLSRPPSQATNSLFKKFVNAKQPFETRTIIDFVSNIQMTIALYNDGLVRACGSNFAGVNNDDNINTIPHLQDVKF
jgi:alpha-tubulin suppressor-like RCC1 family protein